MKLQITSVCLPSVNPFPLKTMSKVSEVCKTDEDIMRSTPGHSPKSTTKYTHTQKRNSIHPDSCKSPWNTYRSRRRWTAPLLESLCMIAWGSVLWKKQKMYSNQYLSLLNHCISHHSVRVFSIHAGDVCYAKSSSMRRASHTVQCGIDPCQPLWGNYNVPFSLFSSIRDCGLTLSYKQACERPPSLLPSST